MFQTLLRVIVIADIVLHLLGVFFQGALDDGGKGQTDTAVFLGLSAHDVRGHGLQTVDEAVIACNLLTDIVDIHSEGQLLVLETLVLLGGLVAGVGQVKQVFLFLGIEHQGILVRLLHRPCQIPEHLLILLPLFIALAAQFLIVFHQFCA